MEKLFKKGHAGISTQLHALQLCDTPTLDPPSDMQQVLDTYSLVFELPTGLLPSRGKHDHNIRLILGIQPPNVCAYRYASVKKNEIKKII